jgi:hypothetical protein
MVRGWWFVVGGATPLLRVARFCVAQRFDIVRIGETK